MPRKTQTTKEDVINAGMDIIRKNGVNSVNARAIAKILNTSVHPIFYHFKNMEDLKETLYKEGLKVYNNYMRSGINSDYSYKSIGLNYIRLAKEEPNIFKMLFMSKTNMTLEKFMMNEDSAYEYIENTISNETKMNKEEILSFHKKMWFFTHGIATLIANNTCSLTSDEINLFLVEEFFALIKLEELKKDDKWKKILKNIKQK